MHLLMLSEILQQLSINCNLLFLKSTVKFHHLLLIRKLDRQAIRASVPFLLLDIFLLTFTQ